MSDTLTAHVTLSIAITKTQDLDIKDIRDSFTDVWELKLSSGTGAGKADLYFRDTRSLEASASEDLDLAGSLTDPFGATVTLAKLKFLAIRNNSTTQTLSVGGAAANQLAGLFAAVNDILTLPPNSATADGGWTVLLAEPTGITVTAGTGDLLKIANSAGAAA